MSVIEVEHLRKRYRDVVAVDDVSFTVERGEIFGILGPNGAGKTTTVEIIEGLRTPDGGTVRVLGLDPRRDGAELRQRVGAQLQESELPDKLKVWEAMELYSSFYDRPADWRRLLEDLGLADKHDTKFGKLSGGQKQRLSIALALVGNPEIAVLDELTTGLDPQARREVWELIEQIRKPPPEALSQRELDVLRLIAAGASNREAAAKLFVSEATIKTHLLHIYEKLGVRDRAGAVGEAYRRRLLT